MSLFEINWKEGIIESTLWKSGKVDKYNKAVDLKAFYMDLYETFSSNKYFPMNDIIGMGNDIKNGDFFEYGAKGGEQVDNGVNLNRTPCLYEKKFTWKKKGNHIEFELTWKARAKAMHSTYGWFEIKIDLVNRFMQDKEFLEGNQKKTLQTGTWEFRNEILYKNNIIQKYLWKVPFIKKSKTLQDLYIKQLYEHTLENDIIKSGLEKIKPIVKEVINKHFGNF